MKNLRKNLIFLVLPMIILLLNSFKTDKLSNSEAEKMLKKEYIRYLTTVVKLNDYGLSPYVSEELKILAIRGFATYKYIPPGTSGYGCYGKLTESGNQYLVGNIDNQYISMAVAKIDFDRITGIKEVPLLNASVVEYTEKIIQIMDIGEIENNINVGKSYKATATFVKYNDGWRIEEMSSNGKKLRLSENSQKNNLIINKDVTSSSLYGRNETLINYSDSVGYALGVLFGRGLINKLESSGSIKDYDMDVFATAFEKQLKNEETIMSYYEANNYVESYDNRSGTKPVLLGYAYGVKIGEGIRKELESISSNEFNLNMLILAYKMQIKGEKTIMTYDEAQIVNTNYFKKKANITEDLNIKKGEEFLSNNKKRVGVKTTNSGLQYEIIKQGIGIQPTINDNVVFHYQVSLIDGTIVANTVSKGKPAEYDVKGLIPGWQEALQLMKVGSKWRIYLPSYLAYGKNGSGKIGPNAALVCEIELLEVE